MRGPIRIGARRELASPSRVLREQLRELAGLARRIICVATQRTRQRLSGEPAHFQLTEKTHQRAGEAVPPGDGPEIPLRHRRDVAQQELLGVARQPR